MKQYLPASKNLIFAILGMILFAVVMACPCPIVMAEAAVASGHTPADAMVVLGSICFAVCWWVGGVAADWVTAFLMVCSWALFGTFTIEESLISFSGSTLWMVIGAFMIAAAVNKTGLLKRIALYLMSLFPPGFAMQVAALIAAGAVCAPLIPSASAKGVLGGSMAFNLSETLEYDVNGKKRTALFMAAWTGFVMTTPAFLTGSAFSYIIKGYMPAEIQTTLTWGNWFFAMLPWLLIFLILMYVTIMVLYGETEDKKCTDKSFLYEQIQLLGKMDHKERITAIVLVLCLLFWILEKQIGISSTTTALIGGTVLFAGGVLEPSDIKTRMDWGLIIFIGSVFCLGSIFSQMGIAAWIASLLNSILGSIENIALLVVLLFVSVYVIRLFVVSQTVVIGLMLGIMMPLMQNLGVNPFLVGIMIYMAGNTWFVLYQNTTYLACYGTMQGTVAQKDAAKCGVGYAIVASISVLVCLPYWQWLGYIN